MPLVASILFTPAAEVLIEIEGRGTVTQFDVRQPLRDYVEKSRIQSDGGTDQCDNDPCLTSLVGFSECLRPSQTPISFEEASIFLSPCSSSQLLSRGILYPVYRCEVLISLDLLDFLGKLVFSVACRSSILP